ncbi:MAG TPA: S53 family peptidase [Candidatus Polarisedimenticolia bacterium]|nr:S53 family peptidase [Candidatus Polarisedimenticolia bacterium]
MVLFSAVLTAIALPVGAADGQFIPHNTPTYVATAKNLGAKDSSQTVDVSIWLNPHNRAALDALASELYNPSSPSYRHWLKSSDIAFRFAPTAAEAKVVQDFLESNNFKVVSVGANHFYVRARGTVADAENAFHVQLNNYQVGGKILWANASDPYVTGPAAALVQAVSGLDSGRFEHPLDIRPASLSPSTPLSPENLGRAASAADASFFQSVCFTGPTTENHTTHGTYPKATYKGNGYYSPTPGCGYVPSNIYGAYNLNGLYAEGYTGAGQTIVIIDWCGSPTIRQDGNVFSERFGLPALTASNFNIINVPGPSACSGVDMEINLDVEWSHAIAPGAKIDLVVPPTANFEDVDEAVYYAVNYGLGNVISGSYASPEFFVSQAELSKENLISEIAAVSGIATNFASGDSASYLTEHLPPTVSVPADLPYATGVGGVSLALNSDNSIAFQIGWESQVSVLVDAGVIYDPPRPLNFYGFDGGAGGGPSAFFAKPPFQKRVPGKYRQVPDVSWLADPFTGGVVLISEPTQLPEQIWFSVGGTSLSTPMFSALWAIANQEAGTALGQAAPYLYSMPATTITDIVPYLPGHDVTAVIQDSSTVTHSYNPSDTLAVLEPLFGEFYSAIWDDPAAENTALTVSFGQNYYVKVGTGWDAVTGVGTPGNAQAFADWFAPTAAKK